MVTKKVAKKSRIKKTTKKKTTKSTTKKQPTNTALLKKVAGVSDSTKTLSM